MKQFRIIIGLIACILLNGCTTITREVQNAANSRINSYPAAQEQDPELDKPLIVSLQQYKSVHSRHPNHSLTIAFAASGGGYRAANLTLGVMLGMEKMHAPRLANNMLQSINYFSTVSGGGFGVGYYLARLHTYLENYPNANFSLNDDVAAMLAHDPAVVNPLRADLTRLLFFGKTRAADLEYQLNNSILATPEGGLKLGDIFVTKNSLQSVQLPYWVTNSTVYQNAVIFPFAPDILRRYQVTGYFHDHTLTTLSGSFANANYGYDVPVSVGLTASASVPFAVPATTLVSRGCGDEECYLQLLDGGLSDNLGVYTALSFLMQDKSKIKILIVADAYKGTVQPYSQLMSPPTTIPLIWRLLTVTTDANREHIQPNIHAVARDLLCEKGASNVIVIYLDLSRYPEAQRVGTQLSLTLEQQKLLLQVGQSLVKDNATIKELLRELQQGHVTLGKC